MLPANKHTAELKNIIEIIIAIIILANRNKNEEQNNRMRFTSFRLLEEEKNGPKNHLFPGNDGFGTHSNQTKSKQKHNHSVLIMCVDAG